MAKDAAAAQVEEWLGRVFDRHPADPNAMLALTVRNGDREVTGVALGRDTVETLAELATKVLEPHVAP